MATDERVGDTNEIMQGIAAAYAARLELVRRMVQDTQRILMEFRERRERMSDALRGQLAKSESLRNADFNRMMDEVLAVHRKREENVQAMLEAFREEEEAITGNVGHLLEKGEAVRIKDFKRMLVRVRKEQQEREQQTSTYISEQVAKMQEEVGKMLETFKQERARMGVEGGQLGGTPAQQPTGTVAAVPQLQR